MEILYDKMRFDMANYKLASLPIDREVCIGHHEDITSILNKEIKRNKLCPKNDETKVINVALKLLKTDTDFSNSISELDGIYQQVVPQYESTDINRPAYSKDIINFTIQQINRNTINPKNNDKFLFFKSSSKSPNSRHELNSMESFYKHKSI